MLVYLILLNEMQTYWGGIPVRALVNSVAGL